MKGTHKVPETPLLWLQISEQDEKASCCDEVNQWFASSGA